MSEAKKRAAFALLVDRFPQAFAVDPKLRKPLKIGIDADLVVAINGTIQRRELGFALRGYCGSIAYLRNCEEGAERIDLDGNAVGTVSAREAEHARAVLAAKAEAKKAATTAIPQPPPAEAPRLSLADLKREAAMRKAAAS